MSADEPAAKRLKQGATHTDTNAVPMVHGRTMHLGLAEGELANLVVCVGSPARAELVSKFLEPEEPGKSIFSRSSDRGFTTYTGMFQGKRISICSIGMGIAMMDFFVREGRQVVHGPMAIVRLGTCGFLQKTVAPGTLSVASKGSVVVRRNFMAFADGAEGEDAYSITGPCPADAELSAAVVQEVSRDLGADAVVECTNATADSFYSSQGRSDPLFDDRNGHLHAELLRRYPDVCSFEMETFMLLHLAQACRPKGTLRAAAAAVNVANRITGAVVTSEKLEDTERQSGKAILRALANLVL